MDLLQLKTLLAVAQHCIFASAARALDQDPSAISRTVAAAEAHLGVRLFERSTRRLAVTGVGRAYLDRIAPLVEELQQAEEEARSARRSPSGTLRITASVAWGQECLVPLLPATRNVLIRALVPVPSSTTLNSSNSCYSSAWTLLKLSPMLTMMKM